MVGAAAAAVCVLVGRSLLPSMYRLEQTPESGILLWVPRHRAVQKNTLLKLNPVTMAVSCQKNLSKRGKIFSTPHMMTDRGRFDRSQSIPPTKNDVTHGQNSIHKHKDRPSRTMSAAIQEFSEDFLPSSLHKSFFFCSFSRLVTQMTPNQTDVFFFFLVFFIPAGSGNCTACVGCVRACVRACPHKNNQPRILCRFV